MNAFLSPRLIRRLLLLLLGLGCLCLLAATASASPPSVEGAASMPILQANIIAELVSDRARLIQVSLVIVTLGCALIWWYR